MARRGKKLINGGKKMGGLSQALIEGGSQVADPAGSRGPKTLRIGKDAMRGKMKGRL